MTVLVGLLKTKFIVHKEDLIKKSDYFATAITGPWTEAQSGSFELESEN